MLEALIIYFHTYISTKCKLLNKLMVDIIIVHANSSHQLQINKMLDKTADNYRIHTVDENLQLVHGQVKNE